MTAKNADPTGDGTIDAISWEGGPQDWIRDCGNCHVGGGQAEYDRDMVDYAITANTGDMYVFKQPTYNNPTPIQVTAGFMGGANKGEVDCLICHMDGSVSGQYWMVSRGCSTANPMGPRNDANCDGTPDHPMFTGLTTVTPPAPGQGYDMHNRNLALKGELLQYGPALGIGAQAVRECSDTNAPCYENDDCANAPVATCDLVGISWDWQDSVTAEPSAWDTHASNLGSVPTILGSKIAYTPKSQNCSVCHGRDDNTIGLTGQVGMRFGYGNYFIWEKPGTMLDDDNASKMNDVVFFELGCKTGMGKRGSRAGQGANDRWGMSMFNVMFGLGKNPGTPIQAATLDTMMGPITVSDKIPDIDVHEMVGQNLGFTDHVANMQCADCHYTVGSVNLDSAVRRGDSFAGTGEVSVAGGTLRGNTYLAETVRGADHQFAKGDISPDGNAKDNLDGTVTCESCHVYMNHPKVSKVGDDYKHTNGTTVPQLKHSGLPAFHLDKIGCTTCHIPETYAAPARKKYRDWTAGLYKGSFRNMLEWNYDLITGTHVPFPMTWKWQTKYGETKIYPFLPSLDPMWYESLSDSRTEAGSQAGVTEDPIPAATAASAPVKARMPYRAALALMNDGTLNPGNMFDIRLNHGDGVPLFDGFQMSDSWEIDTKAEIDAMVATFADPAKMAGEPATIKALSIVQKDFDVSHGVVPKEWALGGTKRGGCVNCHSSSQPYKVAYSCVDLNPGDGISTQVGNACNPYDMNMDACGMSGGTCSPDITQNPAYNENSIGLFEGAIQPLNNGNSFMAAMNGKVGYDYVRNWFALFADFDCTKMTNYMHFSQGMCDLMCRTQMGMPAEQCAQACMPNANYQGWTSMGSCTAGDNAGQPCAMDAMCPGSVCENYGTPQDLYLIEDGGNLFATMCMMTGGQIDPTNCPSFAGAATPTALMGTLQARAMTPDGGPAAVFMQTPLGMAPVYSDDAYFGPGYGYSGMPAIDMSALGTQNNPNCAGLEAGSCDMFLSMCVNMMTATFDDVMGFPSGVAGMMGMWDGVAGLQGFTVKETTQGLHQLCNPFAGTAMGPVSQAFQENVNNCYTTAQSGACTGALPAGMTTGMTPGTCDVGGTDTCTTMNSSYGNACTSDAECWGLAPNDTNPMAYTGTCDSGFGAGHLCWMNADCEGSMTPGTVSALEADPTTMVMTRQTVRSHYKIELQQSTGGTPGMPLSGTPRLTWLLKGEANPGNPDHDMIDGHEDGKIKFDQALNCVNMFNQPAPCVEGSNINIIVPSNFYLGYKPERMQNLMWGANVAPASSVPDLDGDGAPDNTTLMARLSATTAWGRNGANDVILLPDAIAVDATGSVCNNNDGTPTTCTCTWTVDGAVNALATCAGTISATPGLHTVEVTITRGDGATSSKTLQAAAVAASTKPSIATATVTDNGDCTADVDVTSTNASSLLVNCGNGKALVSENFSAGAATAVCDYKDKDGVCIGTEAAIIAIVKDANGMASDSVTVDPEFNPQP